MAKQCFEAYLVGFRSDLSMPESVLREHLRLVRKAYGDPSATLERDILEVHVRLPTSPVNQRGKADAERQLGDIAKALEIGGWQVYVHSETL